MTAAGLGVLVVLALLLVAGRMGVWKLIKSGGDR